MAYYHGVKARQVQTSIATPVTAASGVSFVVGTAPVQMGSGGNINEVIMCMNNGEAVSAFGYSDDWAKYSLCEVMYSHYRLYGTAPVFFVNVLDPEKHKTAVTASDYTLADGKTKLSVDAIAASVVIEGFTENEDYALFYDGEENLVIEVLPDGTIPAEATKLSVAFDKVDPSLVTKADIIGGFNVATKQTTGFELIDTVFPKYGIVPDLLLCPRWSHDAEVAAIMSAKATNINGVFEAKALIDVDTNEVRHYADAPAWKKTQNINDKTQVLLFPMVKLGDKVFHASTHAAGVMAAVDANNGGCPAESPSNKRMQANAAVLADGTEVLLDLQQANYLNSQGITTVLNFIGGFVLWGNETACYPANTDAKDYFLCVSRMFGWVSNSLILTYWNQVDKKFNRRFVETIVDSVNIWLNALVSEEKLMGGRVELDPELNTTISLMSGKAVFHIFMTPPSPAKEIEFVLEYDPSYITAALL